MNCKSQTFELRVDERQIEETVLSIFHTVLFHRTNGKFHQRSPNTYTQGTLGVVDVDCDFIDLTYVRVESNELEQAVRKEVTEFRDALRQPDGNQSGNIVLEFYEKKDAQWPFSAECTPWERWTLKLDVVSFNNEHETQLGQVHLRDTLREKIMFICSFINQSDYEPKSAGPKTMDTSFTDCHPYLFKISYSTTGPSSTSVSTTMRKLLKDTLAF